jgi:hypothetical protein
LYGAGRGAAQPVNARKHTVLSISESLGMFDFLLVGVGIARSQLGAEVRLGLAVFFGIVVALLDAVLDGCVVAGLVPPVAVLIHTYPGADGERDRHQHAEQQDLEAAHGVTSS